MNRICDSDLKVLEMVWENEPISAKDLSVIAAEKIGWNKNTTYTVVTKMVEKGYLDRTDPGFICKSLITRNEVRKNETQSLVNRFFNGSKNALFSALIEDESLTADDIEDLRKMIEKR